jgi:hypothetical protein
MTKKSVETFRDYLRVLESQLSYASTSRILKISQRLIFVWLGESKRAAAAGDTASIYLFKLDEDDPDEGWFHNFCRDVCSASVEEIESGARQRARDGVFQNSKFQGRTVYRQDPALIGKPWLVDLLDLSDDLLRDERGMAVPEQVWTPPSNELALGILAAYSKRYRKQTQGGGVQVNVGGGVQIVGGERPQITAPQPLPMVQIIKQDAEPAEFEEISEAEQLAEMLGAAPDEPDDNVEPTPDGVGVIDRTAVASIGPRPVVPQGMQREFQALVDRGAIAPDGKTIGTTVAPVIRSTTPAEYAPTPSAILSPRTPLNAAEIALLSRLPSTTDRKV